MVVSPTLAVTCFITAESNLEPATAFDYGVFICFESPRFSQEKPLTVPVQIHCTNKAVPRFVTGTFHHMENVKDDSMMIQVEKKPHSFCYSGSLRGGKTCCVQFEWFSFFYFEMKD